MVNIFNALKMFLFLSLFLAAQVAAWAKDPKSGSHLPILDIREVLSINDKFIKDSKIDLRGHKIIYIRYIKEEEAWYVFYRNDSLIIGEHDKMVIISDKNKKKIEFVPW